jgi:hypothetical protein
LSLCPQVRCARGPKRKMRARPTEEVRKENEKGRSVQDRERKPKIKKMTYTLKKDKASN